MNKKFKRSARNISKNQDSKGRVCIKIMLVTQNSRYIKGNIVKTINVEDAKVSEIYDVIEKALF